MRSFAQRALTHGLLIAAACFELSIAAIGNAEAAKFNRGATTRPATTAPSQGTRPSGSTGWRHPGHHGRGPGWGGVGVGVATGVILGVAGANASAPPPPPARSNFAPPPRGSRGGVNIPPASERRFVPDEIVLEFTANFPQQAIAQLLARYRLVQLDRQSFALTNSTYYRVRITDGRPVRTLLRTLSNDVVTLRSGQPNYLYDLTEDSAASASTPGDPAQYALAKLHITEAHSLADGSNVLIAVIDSGIDTGHPELAGVIAGTFDALGTSEPPHGHGTAVAGAIAAHARLMGIAPAARILAIRSFGATASSAEGTTFAILKGLDYAAKENARVINMSFTGPADPALARALTAAHARGTVLVAAAGNLGAKSPPQFPAANPNVIAVTATDADDHLFKASNIGRHIAITAPGVDILLPAPEANYDMKSGTSFAAAHISGIAALMLQRKPDLSSDRVRQIIEATAKDLGPRGRDPEFGAGLADAYQAILAVDRAPGRPSRPLSAAR